MKKGTYRPEFIFFDQEAYEKLSDLLILWQKNSPIRLDIKSIAILKYFANHSVASTYRCFRYLNIDEKIKISYKNVHEKIKKLAQLGFINKKEIHANHDKEVTNHGAIYYQLTCFGLFYVLVQIKGKDFLDVSLDIVYNHKNFFLYNALLYPYIQHQTVEKIGTDTIRYALEKYVHECAVILENMFAHLSTPLLNSIVKIGGLVFTKDFTLESVLENFSMGFPLQQLIDDKGKYRKNYQTTPIVTKDNETMLGLSSDNKILYFKLNSEKLQVYENNDENLIFETDIDPEHDKDLNEIVNSYTQIGVIELLEIYFKEYFRYDMYSNILKLVAGITALSRNSEFCDSKDAGSIGRQDLLLLKKDDNFMSTMFTVKIFMDENYSAFEDLG